MKNTILKTTAFLSIITLVSFGVSYLFYNWGIITTIPFLQERPYSPFSGGWGHRLHGSGSY